jgi:hypothetical protein
MLGRGQRARGVYSGVVFINSEPGMEIAMGEIMKQETLFDFKDGADNLRVI